MPNGASSSRKRSAPGPLATIGVFGMRQSAFDLFLMLGIGLLGVLMRRFDFPTAPVIVGMILGPLAEAQMRNALAIGDAENDHSLLECSGFPVAVANALAGLKQKAARVTQGAAGLGVAELVDLILADALEWPVVHLPEEPVRGDARYDGQEGG
mgnify:CR=1 FL=1